MFIRFTHEHILLKHQDNMTSPSASVTEQAEADCEHKLTFKITLLLNAYIH